MKIKPTGRRPALQKAGGLLTLVTLLLISLTAPAAFSDGPQTVPDIPGGLTTSVVHAGMVDIRWNDTEGADSYEVQVMPSNAWILLPGEGITIAFYGPGAIVRNLPHEGRYYFSVRARNAAGASEWSTFRFQPGTGSPEAWADVPEPVNIAATGVPTILGVPTPGQTLTADTSEIQDENGLERVKLYYQWIWQEGTQTTDIEGATAPAYILHPEDEGKGIRLRVSFTDRGGFTESLASVATATVAPNTAPLGLPEISGTAQVDQTLTVETSGISDADGLDRVRYTYQWTANSGAGDTDIQNANGTSHTLSDTDQGQTIRVRVTFSDDRGNSETLTSAPTVPVAHRPNTPATGLPAIGGKPQVNETLTVDTSGITDANGLNTVSYTYQWILNDGTTKTDIPDATETTYTLAPTDEGKTITVRVTFTDDSQYQETRTSESTIAIGPPNGPASGGPTIDGTAQVGERLTAIVSGITDADGLDNAVFRFQWVRSKYGRDFSDIEGATGSSHTLVTGDIGKTISVRVSFDDDKGNQETLTSPRTVRIEIVACTVGENAPAATAVQVGAVPIVVRSNTAEYFVLYARAKLDSGLEFPVSVTLGQEGTTTLTDQLSPLPREHYRVEKYRIASPADTDGDCIDDITEMGDPAGMNPLNRAKAIHFRNGAVAIPDRETFEALSYKGSSVPYHRYLRNLEFIKFYIAQINSSRPMVYFINTNTHPLHPDFWRAIGGDGSQHAASLVGGEMVFHPNAVAPDGSLGVYRFDYQSWGTYRFERAALINELLAASMPLLDNNLAYHPRSEEMEQAYREELSLFDASRVNVLLAEDILPDIPFLPLNVGQNYGFLRTMSLEENPDPHDVVIYEILPNDLSRVAGIITTVPQTPLSHVNLRAIQDSVPNAFIRDALEEGGAIEDLIGSYVHYTVTQEGYTIRAATPAELEAHNAATGPTAEQVPERDLTVTQITALDEIEFNDWTAFGVKAANVAVLQTLAFPEGTVPDGFGVPFYFYDEFMKHNGFYDDIETMLADAEFQSDPETQDDELKALRKKIKKGSTPQWIIDALTAMHATYPDGQSLRYRSSTNNEDLPGFSGAGLYDSKTQDPDETAEDGIDKSIKAVYASLWNFRAFTERESHGVDHLATAMGVLVHPNYSDELANGVAVSFDPSHHTYGSYYVNTQLGEDLVTNPEAHSVPEEILLHRDGAHSVLATSNQVTTGQLLMSDAQMDQLRSSLRVIHEEFEDLYAVESNEPFAIEIEFKITSDNILAIKQARPWVFGENASRPNSPATGIPTIEGTPHVNQTLTADTSGIADADGLTNPTFTYQWTRTDGTTDTDVTGETSSTHTVTEEDAGNHLKVSVTFTDDLENLESLTSTTTKAVVDYDTDEDRLIEITTLQQLHAVRHDLDGNGMPTDDGMASYAEAFPASADQMGCPGTEGCMGYELMADLDFDTNGSAGADSADAYWNDGAGWTPIGGDGSRTSYDLDTMVNPFLAIFEGNGHSLSNLFINRLNPFTGMFGYIGSDSESGAVAVIRNLNLVDINVTGDHYTGGLVAVSRGVVTRTQVSGLVAGGEYVGGMVGQNYGIIADSHLTGCVSGDRMVGGVVGRTYGAITKSSFSGCVSGTDYVGGLAGNNYGPISASHTEGQVSGNTVVGGLVGSHKGTITASRSSARVSATGSAPVPQITGGLVGDNRGAITVSYATGDVSGKGWVGGLVGQSSSGWESNSAITASYATGRVSGTTTVGGLVGTNGGAITASYARGEVSGSDNVGGMSGSNDGTITASYWDTTVWGQSSGNHGEGKTTEELQTPTGYSDIYEPWNLESNDIAGSPLDLGSATQHLALAAGLDTDSDHVLDYPWDLGSSSQYPALAADLNGDGRATWQEFGHQLRAVPVLTATVPAGEDNFELTWTPVDTSHWSPVPRLTYTLYRDDGDTVEAIAEQLEGLKHTDNDVTSGEAYAYQVVATITGGETAHSAWVSATLETNTPATGAPTISGTAQSGATLTADTTGIADADGLTSVSYNYQWIAGESDISGATNSSYTLTSNEEGQTIQVRVSFPDDAGNPETLTSIATDAVGPQYDDAEEAPMWSADMLVVEYTGVSIGAATADLFSNIGGSGGLQVRSLWSYTLGRDLRLAFTDGVPGAAEYTLQVGDLALAFPAGSSGQSSFKWTDVDVDWEDGHTIPVSIVATSTLAEPTPNTPATGEPTISGTPQVGVTLTADVSGITDADGLTSVSYNYQWIRNDGNADTDIEDVTASTYTLVTADQGKTIKVKVSFTDDADNEETLTSVPTAEVAARTTPSSTSAPAFATSTTSRSIAENSEAGTAVGRPVVATDTDEDTITYTLGGPAMTAFEIDGSGQIRVGEETALDYESRETYTVEIIATDSSGETATITVTIMVTDVIDPNIVLIMADDVGYEVFGANGSTQYLTPQLDDLAGAGVRFTNAHSKPCCSPSRVALMTGKSNVRNYVDLGVLPRDQYLMVDLFREAGYATAIAGKWRLDRDDAIVEGVAGGAGFDTYCLWGTRNAGDKRYWNASPECDGQVTELESDEYGPDVFVNFLLEFIESNQDRPFFAYYPMVLSHPPFVAPPQSQCPGDDEQCIFEDMVAYMDGNVGRLHNKLAELELLDNTIVLFTSDNGTPHMMVSALNGETIYADKATTRDISTHVPLFVHVPGEAAGRVVDDLIDFTDFLPTLADAAGLTVPNAAELDGVSFWDRLQGKPGNPRKWLYTYYFRQPYASNFDSPPYHPEVAFARDKRYKLYDTGELFDVSIDPHELYPLPGDDEESSDARTKLQAALDSMPDKGQAILWSLVNGTAIDGRPRWRPVLSGARVTGDELTLTYAGYLDEAVRPPVETFTVKVDGIEWTVSAVSINRTTVTLTLASPVVAGQTVTVSYTPGKKAIRHVNRRIGHKAVALTDVAVKNVTVPNHPPTGAPTISGTPQVGQELTADVSSVADADGLTNVSYRYQWVVNDGATDAEIEGATASTYTPSASDVGKTIEVKVSFSDDADHEETLTSVATEAVAATKPGAPGHQKVFPHDTGALDVYWEAPTSNGGSAITGYKVQWKETADSWNTEADVSEATVTGTTHTITGLTEGVEYTVRVMAVNDVGEGAPSSEASGTPQEEPIWSTTLTVGVAEAFAGYTIFLPNSNVLGRSLVRHHHVGRRQLHREGPGGSGRQVDSLRDAKTDCRVCPRVGDGRIRLYRRIDPRGGISLTVPVERPGTGLAGGGRGRRQTERARRQQSGHRPAHHQRNSAGWSDADSGRFRHLRRGRADQRFLPVPVDPERWEYQCGHRGCDRLNL